MQPRFAGRKTVRKTASKKNKKIAVQKWRVGQNITIQGGAFRGRMAKIVRATRGGVIAAVAEPFLKNLTAQGVPRMKTRHRLVFVPNNSFELFERSEPKSEHGKMSHKERFIKGKKLGELLKFRADGHRVKELEAKLAEPGLSKRSAVRLRGELEQILAMQESSQKRAAQLSRELKKH